MLASLDRLTLPTLRGSHKRRASLKGEWSRSEVRGAALLSAGKPPEHSMLRAADIPVPGPDRRIVRGVLWAGLVDHVEGFHECPPETLVPA